MDDFAVKDLILMEALANGIVESNGRKNSIKRIGRFIIALFSFSSITKNHAIKRSRKIDFISH